MRSEQVYHALAHGHTRFEICQLVFKHVKLIHQRGARFEDTITYTFDHLGTSPARGKNIGVHLSGSNHLS
jgi:hypothetical protein